MKLLDSFLVAATAPRSNHSSGTLEEAEAILATHPDLAVGNLYASAVLGHEDEVARLVAEDRTRAVAPGGPYDWDPLTHLCFSRYLRLRPSERFVATARILLDAGADPDTGFFEPDHQPAPTFESALYGAAGVARHAGLTRLLLDRGGDPNLGGEVGYHAPEGFDSEAMEAVVLSGRLSSEGLTTMLHRKLDWTDLGGVRWLLEHGADPNQLSSWGSRALPHALQRGNALPLIEALLDAGADPRLQAPAHGDGTAVAMAARAGRADVLDLFSRRGYAIELEGDDGFFAALALGDRAATAAAIAAEPGLVGRLEGEQPGVIVRLAGADNAPAVALALDLGFRLSSEALSVAVWRERTDTVRLLLARGAAVVPSHLVLAQRALTEMSEWTPHRSRVILDALEDALPGTP